MKRDSGLSSLWRMVQRAECEFGYVYAPSAADSNRGVRCFAGDCLILGGQEGAPGIAVSCWCGRGDSNPYGLATASPSSWCVCQFRHFRLYSSPAAPRDDPGEAAHVEARAAD